MTRTAKTPTPKSPVFTVQIDPAHLEAFDAWADHNDRTRSGQFRWMMKNLMLNVIDSDLAQAPDDIRGLEVAVDGSTVIEG